MAISLAQRDRLTAAALLLLGVSLLIPGIVGLFAGHIAGMDPRGNNSDWNQLYGLQGMMAGIGAVACWCAGSVERNRMTIAALGWLLVFTVSARVLAVIMHGWPAPKIMGYALAEAVFASLLLIGSRP